MIWNVCTCSLFWDIYGPVSRCSMGWPAHILLYRPNINTVNYKMQSKSLYLKHFKPLLRVEMGREMHEKMVMLLVFF